jgi:DNA-directed RNA polymerase
MLTEPNNWTNDTTGGYYLNEITRQHTLVRNGDPTLLQPGKVLEFLNKLQHVPYTINQHVLSVAMELEEKGYKIGKFLPLSAASLWEMPTRPDTEDKEVLFEWRKAKTDAENRKKAYMRSMHVRTSITLDLAKKFKDKDEFYLPWSFDYRGRAYPIPPFLTIQDTDFGKSMLLFKEAAFMTPEAEQWLAFQVATTYGLDKASMADRQEWVTNNQQLITVIAEDPIGNIHEWEGVEEPWQFLAACDEYYRCCIACVSDFTSIPIATDATCSGMQILAGLSRDKSTAQLVNVVPSDKPQDAYKTVAEAMIPLLPEELKHLAEHIDRSVTKRSVMTIPYNATAQSSADYIRKALKEKNVVINFTEAYQLAAVLREAMDIVAPGPLRVMDWIKKEMGNAIKRGATTIDWVTPSGFCVKQKRNKYTTKRLDLKLLGGTKFSIIDGEKGPDKRKHQSSGAPNLIHSLDASLLHLSFLNFNAPFSVIHDSVLCRATDMSVLSTLVRETYMNMFAENNFLEDFAKQIGAETPPPIVGDLEPSSVIESTYFFC